MRIVFMIILISGISIILAGIGSLLNYFFNLNLSMEDTRLPSDPGAAIMFFVVGIVFVVIGYVFTAEKPRAWISQHRAMAFLLFIIFFGVTGGSLYTAVWYHDRDQVLYEAIKQKNQQKLARLLEEKKWDQETLDGLVTWCIHEDNAPALKIAVAKGARVKRELDLSYHETPLLLSVYKGSPALLKVLIDAGADPLFIDRETDANAILHTVAGSNTTEEKIEIISLLLKKGVDINRENKYGAPPLLEAFKKKDLKLARFLARHGADVNQKDRFKRSILYRCIDHFEGTEDEKLPFVRLLLNKGAQAAEGDNHGTTPADVARRKGYKKILRLLE